MMVCHMSSPICCIFKILHTFVWQIVSYSIFVVQVIILFGGKQNTVSDGSVCD